MKRMRIVGLSLIAAFAMSAIAVTSASATAPEIGRCLKKTVAGGAGFSDAGCLKAVGTAAKYEWTTTLVKNKETSVLTSTLATLEGEGKVKISCKHQKTPPFTITGPKEINGIVGEYTECASSSVPCENKGAGSGSITTTVLEATIGVEKLGEKEGKKSPLAEQNRQRHIWSRRQNQWRHVKAGGIRMHRPAPGRSGGVDNAPRHSEQNVANSDRKIRGNGRRAETVEVRRSSDGNM